MKTKLLMLTLAGVILFAGPSRTEAASKASPTPAIPDPTPGPRTARPLPFSGKIFSVDAVAKTFSTQNHEKKIRVYEITPDTKLTKKNSAATFEDLKPGFEIRGMATPKGDGRFDTQSVIIGDKEEPKPVPVATPLPVETTKPSARPKSSPKKAKTPAPSSSPKKQIDD